jgi:hypothetical protein
VTTKGPKFVAEKTELDRYEENEANFSRSSSGSHASFSAAEPER